MTIRQPGDVVGLCPVCHGEIDLLNPDQVPVREGESTQERIDRIVEANESLILAHAKATHSLRDAMVALGTARSALIEIRDSIGPPVPGSVGEALVATINRGLGEGQ